MEELSLVEILEEEFLVYIKKMEVLEEVLVLVYWDFCIGVLLKGMEGCFDVIGVLFEEIFNM